MTLHTFSVFSAFSLVGLLGAGWLPGCGQTADLADRPCPCAEGWTCCGGGEVCVAPGSECPDAAVLQRDAAPADAATTHDASHPSDVSPTLDAGPVHIFARGQAVACATSDSTNLYWVNTSGALVSVAQASGLLNVLATEPAPAPTGTVPSLCSVVQSGAGFYEVSASAFAINHVGDVSDAGGGGAPVIAEGASSVVATGTGSVWVTQPQMNRISQCAVPNRTEDDSCMPGVVLSGLAQPDNLIGDAENLYWIDRGDGTIMRSSKTTLAASVVVPAADADILLTPQQMTLATSSAGKTRLFWPTLSGAAAINVDGSGYTALQNNPTFESGAGIASDGVNVYWANEGGLNKAPAMGGTPVVLAAPTGVNGASFVVVVSGNVYWQDNDENVWVAPK